MKVRMKVNWIACVGVAPSKNSGCASKKAPLPAPRQRSGVVATVASGGGVTLWKTGAKPSHPCQ
jgi:hypothetical protein